MLWRPWGFWDPCPPSTHRPWTEGSPDSAPWSRKFPPLYFISFQPVCDFQDLFLIFISKGWRSHGLGSRENRGRGSLCGSTAGILGLREQLFGPYPNLYLTTPRLSGTAPLLGRGARPGLQEERGGGLGLLSQPSKQGTLIVRVTWPRGSPQTCSASLMSLGALGCLFLR